MQPPGINDSHSNKNLNLSSKYLLREQKTQTQNHKIHKNHYLSITNFIPKHRKNQNFSTIKDTIKKEYKKPKKSIKSKTNKRDVKKKKKKVPIQKINTHVTMPESQPTPASIGLSQAQH